MNELEIFNYGSTQIRTVQIDSQPWFVLKDVCEVFGETNYRRVTGRLDDDEKGVSQIDTPGGIQSMTVVNEPGLYSVLFAMQPEKARGVSEDYIAQRQAQLKSFKRWITHDVIPTLRRTGTYSLTMSTPPLTTRTLTVDDYLKAAQIVANCRNERMPYVMSFLRQAGLEMPGEELAKLEARKPGIMLTKEEKAAVIDEAIQLLWSAPYTVNQMAAILGINNANLVSYYRHGQRRPSVERARFIIETLKPQVSQIEEGA